MSFKIGQKVVCVDNSRMYGGFLQDSELIKDEIYTIKETTRNGQGCIIYEVSGEFKQSRFRPLDYDFVEEVISNLKKEPILI